MLNAVLRILQVTQPFLERGNIELAGTAAATAAAATVSRCGGGGCGCFR